MDSLDNYIHCEHSHLDSPYVCSRGPSSTGKRKVIGFRDWGGGVDDCFGLINKVYKGKR